jgi:hypothetical protein
MAKKTHGARQQKRLAKLKAKRLAKRSVLARRNSTDPTMRLERADQWPIVQALVGAQLWNDGIGYLVLVRQESQGRLVSAVFLVDVYCLGVKNAFWRAGSHEETEDMIRQMDQVQRMRAITPACLAKIIKGAIEFAQSFGFRPHPDYRHASILLDGIDPSTCPNEFTFGRDGRPYYIQGPNESPAEVKAIIQRTQDAGGHFVVMLPDVGSQAFPMIEGAFDELDTPDEDDLPDESP